MNGLDAGLGVVLFLFAWRGFWRGFARELFGLVGVGLGIILGLHFAPVVAPMLEPYLPVAVAPVVAFAAVFVLTDIAANLVAVAVETIAGFLLFSVINRLGGALLAALKGTVLLAALLLVVTRYLPDTPVAAMVEQSALGRGIVTLATLVADATGLGVTSAEQGLAEL